MCNRAKRHQAAPGMNTYNAPTNWLAGWLDGLLATHTHTASVSAIVRSLGMSFNVETTGLDGIRRADSAGIRVCES